MTLSTVQSAANIHVVTSGATNPGALTASFSTLPSVGDAVVVCVSEEGLGMTQTLANAITVSDNQGNTYTLVGANHQGGASNDTINAVYFCGGIASPSGTFTISVVYDWAQMAGGGNNGACGITIIELSQGATANAVGGNSGTGTSLTATTTGKGNPGDWCVATFIGTNNGSGNNFTSPFSGTSTWLQIQNQSWPFNGAAIVNTLTNLATSTTVTATTTNATSSNMMGMEVATFTPVGGPTGPPGNGNILESGSTGLVCRNPLSSGVYIFGAKATTVGPPNNVVTVDNATSFHITYPSPPLGLSGTSGTQQVTLTWNASSGNTQHAFPFTVGQFANLLLFTWASYSASGNGTPISVTYGNQNLTRLTSTTKIYNNCATDIWYLVNPPTGTNQLVYQINGTDGFQLPGCISLNSAQLFGTGIAGAGDSPATAASSATGVSTGGLYVSVLMMGAATVAEGQAQTIEWSNIGFQSSGTTVSSLCDIKTANGNFTWNGSGGPNLTWAVSTIGINVLGTGTAVPAAPTGLTAVASSGQVALTWVAANLATSYNVYQGTTAGGENITPVITGIAGTSQTVTGLVNGTTYFFYVKGVNAAGTSASSNEISATPGISLTPPTNLTASAGNGTVSLSWTASAQATSYNIYQGTTAGGEGAAPALTGIATNNVIVSGLTNGTAYFFKVAAVNGTTISGKSNEATATPSTGGGGGGSGGGGAYDGVIAVSGNQFINGHGLPIKLRGGNTSGLENDLVNGAPCPWCFAGYGNGPPPSWALYATTWGSNVVRIPLNSASFAGNHSCGQVSQVATANFTGGPAGGSTGATLTSAWGLASGQYCINWNGNSSPQTLGTFTQGSTAVSWPALVSGAGASASVLGFTGTQDADPFNNYRSTIIAAINSCRSVGMYINFDLHWDNPNITLGGVTHQVIPQGQNYFITANGLTFWQTFAQWLATNFGSASFNTANGYNGGAAGANFNASFGGSSGFNDIMFELYNEPIVAEMAYGVGNAQNTPPWAPGGVSLDPHGALKTGGWGYSTIDAHTNNFFYYPWQIIGYQQVTDWFRQNHFTNVVICNPNQYSQEIKHFTQYVPTDALNQVACGWHPYPATSAGGWSNPWPYTAYGPYGWIGSDNGFSPPSPNDIQEAVNILKAGLPVFITEDGDQGGPSFASPASPHCTYMEGCCDILGLSYEQWSFAYGNPPGNNSSDVIVTFDGTNTGIQQGQGTSWLGFVQGHPNTTIEIDNQTAPAAFTTGTTNSFTHTVGAGANFLMVIWHAGHSGVAPDATSVSANGIAMNELTGSFQQHNHEALSIWYLSGPPTGSVTIAVNTSTAATVQMPVALSFRNVNGSSPFGAIKGANAGGQALSISTSGAQQGGTYLCAMIMDATAASLNHGSMNGNAPYQAVTQQGGGSKYIFDGFYAVNSANATPLWAMNGSGSGADGWVAVMIPMNPGTTVVTPPTVPGSVTNLTAVASNSQIALSWTAATNALSYNIYQGTTPNGESSTPTNVTATNATITGLSNGTTYYFKVAGINGSQAGPLSNEVSAAPTSGTSGGGISGTITNPGGTALFVNSNKLLVNGAGTQVQLHGWNHFGYETTALQGWNYFRPDGGGQNMALRTQCLAWHCNLVRLPINQAAWLGSYGQFIASRGNQGWVGWTYETPSHRMDSPDPGGNWFSSLNADINFCTQNGIYVIIDMHWTMPADMSPQQQVLLGFTSGTLQAWQQIAQFYKNNRAVMFELFNEPITGFGADNALAYQQLFQPGNYAQPGELDLNYAPPYNENVFSLDVSNVTGVFFPGDTISQNGGPQNMSLEAFDKINPQIHYTNPSNYPSSTAPSFSPGALNKISGRQTDTLISNNLSFFTTFLTSSGTAANLHSADYTQQWVTATGAAGEYVAWDFTALFAANTAIVSGAATGATVLAFCWYCDGDGTAVQNWDSVGNGVPLDAPASYQVQITNQPFNASNVGTPNGQPWTTVRTVTVKSSQGQEILQVNKSGIRGVRFLFGGTQTGAAIRMKMDIYDVTTGMASGVLCMGDDITAGFAGNLAVLGTGGPLTGPGIMSMIPSGGFITGATVGAGGSGYTNGTYTGIPLTGGSGTNALATLTISGGALTAVQIDCKGQGYAGGNSLGFTIPGGGSGGTVNVSSTQTSGFYNGNHTSVMNCGQKGWKAADWLNYMTNTYPEFLQNFWGRYVVIELGTTDFNGGVSQSSFITSLTAIANAIRKVNKIPVICSLPFNVGGDVTPWNSAITTMISTISGCIAGPDLYSFFQARQYMVTLGPLNITIQGLSAIRSEYANFLCAQTNNATATITVANRGAPLADYTTCLNAIRGMGAANICIMGGPGYANFLDQWLNYVPTDTVTPPQICAAWHPYPPVQSVGSITNAGSSGTGTATAGQSYATGEGYAAAVFNVNGGNVSIADGGQYLQTNEPGQISASGSGCSCTVNVTGWNNKFSNWSVPSNWPTALNVHHSYPLLVTETGDWTFPGGGTAAPWSSQMTPWFDSNKVHVAFWSDHLTQTGQIQDLCLGQSTSGDDSTAQSPSPAYGQFVFNWMSTHSQSGT